LKRIILALLTTLLLTGQAHAITAYLSRYATANDGLDDTEGLREAILAADRVIITPGQFDFVGPLLDPEDEDLMYAFGRCRIIGPADESAAQHQEEGRTTDRWVSLLRVTGLDPGEYWVEWQPTESPPGTVDRGGPMELSNTSIRIIGDGCALNYGDSPASTDLLADLRKLTLSGLYVTAPDQLVTGDYDGTTLPDYSQFHVVQIHRGYDVKVRDIGIRGGGIRFHGCDRARLIGAHIMHCTVGVTVDNLATQVTVPCVLDDVFVEDYIGTAIYAESAQCDMLRCEAGYDRDVGATTVSVVSGDWDIVAGDDYVNFSGTGVDCTTKFFHGQLVSLDADTYLIVDEVDATGFTFVDATRHCYFEDAQEGSSLTAYYGVGLIGTADRFSVGQWSVDFNDELSGLPVGAFNPGTCTMPVGPWINGQSEFMDATNRSVIVGHCTGGTNAMEGSVHFAGKMMAPDQTHPLYHPGIGPVPDRNINGWTDITYADDAALKLRFRRKTGTHVTTGVSTTHWAVTPSDAEVAGMVLPAAATRSFEVYATGAGNVSCYFGSGQAFLYPFVAGWQTIEVDQADAGVTATLIALGGTGYSVKVEGSDD
jgi:hypothetical protein